MSFNNALVAVSVLPGGLVFGFYLFFRAYDVLIQWPLITAPACAVVISCAIVVKKRIQQKYTFDNLYYNSLACGFYIVSGLFFMRHSVDIASYIGLAGNGVSYISSLTYAGYTASNTKDRHRAVTVVHLFLFLGMTVAAVLHGFTTVEDAEFKCGLTLIGLSICILGILISNQILNQCGLNNYRTSSDSLWNYYNIRNWLYKNRPDTMAIYQRMDNRYRQSAFAIVRSKESITVFFILVASLVNFIMFYNVTMGMGFAVSLSTSELGSFFWRMLVTTGGFAICISFFGFLAPKTIYTAFGTIKCAALVCILVVLNNYSLSTYYIIYYFIYFFCMGIIYSIPVTMLLEVSNPRNCEIVLATTYFLQIILVNAIMYFSNSKLEFVKDLQTFVRILYIAYITISALAIIFMQIFHPIEGSLIEIRNYLLGIRKSKVVSFTT